MLRRHHLGGDANGPEGVTRALIASHASDPASVYLSVLARSAESKLADVADAMYERRSLVRWMAMRRTLFVFSRKDIATVRAAVSTPLAAMLPRRLVGQLQRNGSEPVIDEVVDRWLAGLEDRVGNKTTTRRAFHDQHRPHPVVERRDHQVLGDRFQRRSAHESDREPGGRSSCRHRPSRIAPPRQTRRDARHPRDSHPARTSAHERRWRIDTMTASSSSAAVSGLQPGQPFVPGAPSMDLVTSGPHVLMAASNAGVSCALAPAPDP